MILLDTHIWVWMNIEPGRVPASVLRAVSLGETMAISVVSVWETMILLQRGRIESKLSAEDTVNAWRRGNPLSTIDLSLEAVMLSRTLPFKHEDPADRFIAATALHVSAPLATSDIQLLALPWLPCLDLDA